MARSADHRSDVEGLFDDLSNLPPKEYCDKCGSAVLYTDMTFFSQQGRAWIIPMPVCPYCDLEGGWSTAASSRLY
jgi:hypothetical protein